MECPRCGAEMVERRGLTTVWYCSSAECGYCIEDINLAGAARRLADQSPPHDEASDHGRRRRPHPA